MEIIKFDLQSYLWIFLPIILVLINAYLSKLARMKRKSKNVLDRYSVRQSILTTAEGDFFKILKRAVGEKFIVFSKVRLADIFLTKNGDGYLTALNKITSKHIDFLLCDPETFTPKLTIELDDKSHEKQNRKERDQFVEQLFESQGLPLLRVKVSRNYEVSEIRDKLLESLKSKKE